VGEKKEVKNLRIASQIELLKMMKEGNKEAIEEFRKRLIMERLKRKEKDNEKSDRV